jgi:membrane-associated protease RseP (regulator of RpoE activity)
VSTGPELIHPAESPDRNWLALAVAAAIVIAVVAGVVLVLNRGQQGPTVAPVTAAPDPYAVNLPITNVAMSEATNTIGGKVTYLDGHIANKGGKTVTGITVQTLFRNVANEVAQNVSQPMQLIRTREPYVDVQPVSAAPLKPGDERDFRLAFDSVTPNWNGEYPQLRILRVQTQ